MVRSWAVLEVTVEVAHTVLLVDELFGFGWVATIEAVPLEMVQVAFGTKTAAVVTVFDDEEVAVVV